MLNIVDKSVKSTCLFGVLQPGDVFKWYEQIYIKSYPLDCVPICNLTDDTVTFNAFCFDENEFHFFNNKEEVIPYNAEMTIYMAD